MTNWPGMERNALHLSMLGCLAHPINSRLAPTLEDADIIARQVRRVAIWARVPNATFGRPLWISSALASTLRRALRDYLEVKR